jgi:hypothetical protein
MSDFPPGQQPSDDDADHRRPTPEWGGKFADWLVRVFISGMVLTDLSITLGYHGRAGVSAIAAVVAVTVLVRGLHPRAPLRRYAPWPLLTSAAFAAAVAAFSWGPGARTPAIVALVLTACAGLLAPDLKAAARLLAGAAVIGAGVAVVGAGMAMLANRDVAVSAAVIGAGMAVTGVGAAMLTDREALVDAALVGAGVAVAGVGTAMLAKGDVAVGAALMGAGAAIVGVAVPVLANREVGVATASIGAAMAAIGIGLAMLAGREVLFSAAAIGVAVALAVCGVAIIGFPTLRSAFGRLAGRVTKAPPDM